jgi:hypothetical protein
LAGFGWIWLDLAGFWLTKVDFKYCNVNKCMP